MRARRRGGWRSVACAAFAGLVTMHGAPRPAAGGDATESAPDAALLLDLDLLKDADLSRDRELLRRLRVVERIRLWEKLGLFETDSAAASTGAGTSSAPPPTTVERPAPPVNR